MGRWAEKYVLLTISLTLLSASLAKLLPVRVGDSIGPCLGVLSNLLAGRGLLLPASLATLTAFTALVSAKETSGSTATGETTAGETAALLVTKPSLLLVVTVVLVSEPAKAAELALFSLGVFDLGGGDDGRGQEDCVAVAVFFGEFVCSVLGEGGGLG